MTSCGRSDCRKPATIEILARSESGRTWVGSACELHWEEKLAMIEALGFEPFRSIDLTSDQAPAATR